MILVPRTFPENKRVNGPVQEGDILKTEFCPNKLDIRA